MFWAQKKDYKGLKKRGLGVKKKVSGVTNHTGVKKEILGVKKNEGVKKKMLGVKKKGSPS